MAPRLIAVGIDGDGRHPALSRRAEVALGELADIGTLVVIMTAGTLADVHRTPDAAAFVVASNGAALHDAATGELWWHAGLPVPVARSVVEHLRSVTGLRFDSFVESVDPTWHREPSRWGLTRRAEPVTLCRVRLHLLDAAAMLPLVSCSLPPGLGLILTAADRVELVPSGIDRAGALARLAGARGIQAADAVVFGSGASDWTAMHWAGTSITVAGSEPATCSLASRLLDDAADDPIADELDRLAARARSRTAPEVIRLTV